MRDQAKRIAQAIFRMDKTYQLHKKRHRGLEAELCIMYALDDGKPHSQREIADEWLIPRTTMNTIAKRWEKAGYLTLTPIPGKRREMAIVLTEAGKTYARGELSVIHRAEDKALTRTLQRYPAEFIGAMEYFFACLREALQEEEERC